MNHYRTSTTYFLTEGKANLAECLRLSFKKAIDSGISIIVVYTAAGDGLEMACTKYLADPFYEKIRVVGVSLPVGTAPHEALHISEQRIDLLNKFKVTLIRAANPFEDIPTPQVSRRNLVVRAFECFSGGMSLCISAAVIACDAGFVVPGAHVISMSADTSVIVKAVPSSHALSSLTVREIICKPTILDISKKEVVAAEVNAEALLKRQKSKRKLLTDSSSD